MAQLMDDPGTADAEANPHAPFHLPPDRLHAGLDHVRATPADEGPVVLVLRRPAPGRRELVDEAALDPAHGVVGDNWRERGSRRTADGAAEPERQLTIMNVRVASLVAGGEERVPLAGDQVYVDLDLSHENLPTGTRLALGTAVVEVTEPPHTGCAKFSQRFGREALRLVNTPEGRAGRLRGMYARIVDPGVVRPGDVVRKLP